MGGLATPAERDRLAALLGALPTTLEADQALLAAEEGLFKKRKKVADWRDRALLELRVARKRALKRVVEVLNEGLESAAEL